MARFPKTSLIGSGSVGSTIAFALHKKGYPVVSIINRTGTTAKQLAKKVHCRRVSTIVDDIASDTHLLLLGANDDALPSIVDHLCRLKSLKFKKMFIIHFSGVHTSDLLQPLKKKGAIVASVHPIQSFPKSTLFAQLTPRLRGCYYGIEGDEQGLENAEQFVGDLGGKIVVIPKELKPLYHIACVFASNYFIVLLNAIREIATGAKLYISWTELFGPLMTASMQNAIVSGPVNALTGPIVRNDSATVSTHLTTLERYAPQFIPLYTICGIEAARMVKQSGRITNDEYESLLKQFKTFIHTQPIRKR
jgi:predicted short-subunit dehydrogenase-like oxidoreductase (DUF2520 family)